MIQRMLSIWSLVPLPFLKPAWTMEWVAFPFSRGSSQPRDRTQVSHIAGRFFTSWDTRETHIGLNILLKLVLPLCARAMSVLFLSIERTAAAAAAAKSLQLCLTLCDPIDGSPPGSPIPRILQAKIAEWVAISFSSAWKWKVKVKSLSRVQLLAIPWTAAYQAPLSMGFSRQEYWSGVPLPSLIERTIYPFKCIQKAH